MARPCQQHHIAGLRAVHGVGVLAEVADQRVGLLAVRDEFAEVGKLEAALLHDLSHQLCAPVAPGIGAPDQSAEFHGAK